MTNAYLNLAGYLFADLDELPALQQRLRRAGEHLQLRGTVLLAPEGINLFISAAPAAARQWLAQLRGEQPFLHVMRANPGAHRLYEAMGFRDHAESVVRVVARG